MQKPKYSLEIEPGQKKQTWNYKITSPTGEQVFNGIFNGTKAELIERHKRTLKRLNDTIGGWRARQPEKPKPNDIEQADPIIYKEYPNGGWQRVHQLTGGKFTKKQIWARAYKLGVKCNKKAKNSRWTTDRAAA